MPHDPYAVLRALLRAEGARRSPKSDTGRPQAPGNPGHRPVRGGGTDPGPAERGGGGSVASARHPLTVFTASFPAPHSAAMAAPSTFRPVGFPCDLQAHRKRPAVPRPRPGEHRQWADVAPRPVRLDQLVTTKGQLDLETLLAEDSTFYGDLFAHVVKWQGDLYLEDGLHRAVRAALQQRQVLHARVLELD